MNKELAILLTLIVYKIVLVGIGFWANRRTNSSEDFFIGGKTLGPWVAAISSSASASSAWSLLGVSGAAYFLGVGALWLFPAVISGYIFNWCWLAPRIRELSETSGAVTLSELLAGQDNWKKYALWCCSFIIVFSFIFYIAAQFQAAGSTFSTSFGISQTYAIALGTGIILVYTLLGGFWAVSLTDTLQGSLMALVALVLPFVALLSVGGFDGLMQGLSESMTLEQMSATGSFSGLFGVAFVLGMLGVGIGYPGQPHVVNRFMALRDKDTLFVGRIVGIGWPVIVFGGMLLLGLCAKVLVPHSLHHENVLFEVTNLLFHPVVAGVIIAAVLSAIMSTADSQLLVCASSLSYDLSAKRDRKRTLLLSRLTVVLICVLSMLLALYAPEAIFSRVLFAWSALGSAFGPLLIVMLMGYQVKGPYRVAAIMVGFSLTVLFNWQENTPGDVLERVGPFISAFLLAWLGRADKGPATIKTT